MSPPELTVDFVRAFIAVAIGEDVRQALAGAQARLKSSRAHVGWVAPDHIHLTLAFLGETPASRLPELRAGLDTIATETLPFGFAVQDLGSFGGNRPRVVWAGVVLEDAAPLSALQGRVVAMLKTMGLPTEDREFHAHLTLGRTRSSRGSEELVRYLAEFKGRAFGRVDVSQILLMRSQLRPEGPVYSVLHSAALRGQAGPEPSQPTVA